MPVGLTRFGGYGPASGDPGIAYQSSLGPEPLSAAFVPDTSIASPESAMVSTPRTAVTGAQQLNNVSATLPVMQPGLAPTTVPDSDHLPPIAIGLGIVLLVILFGGTWGRVA